MFNYDFELNADYIDIYEIKAIASVSEAMSVT